MPTTEHIGPYRVLRRLAVGGMGEVWLARAPDGRRVCVKRVLPELSDDEEFVLRFVQEIEIARSARHPNVVEILDHGQDDDGRHFLVMEHVQGSDLDTLLRRSDGLPWPVVAHIGAELARALEYIRHRDRATGRAALIHCDVTPPNILLGRDGAVKLSDFGVAKTVAATDVATHTALRGRTAYYAPEQLAGEAIDSRVDVFVLGIVMWRALVGSHPYAEDRPTGWHLFEWIEERTMRNARRPVQERAPDANPALHAVIEGALQLLPARTPTAATVLDALSPLVPPDAPSRLTALVARLGPH